MMPPKDILVIGATGNIGRHILQQILLAKPPFGRIGIFTSEATLSKKSEQIDNLKDKGVEILTGNLTNAKDVASAYKGFDTIVTAVGRPIIEAQTKLLEIAEATENVKYFYPSEYGTDIEYGPKSKDEPTHQGKLKVRKYIKDNIKRLQYTYLVTGPYADMYFNKIKDLKAGGFDIASKKAGLLGTGKEKISLTTMRDVGKYMVASLRNPERSKDKALVVNSFTTTPDDILAEFEKQTGSKWEKQYTSLDELKAIERTAYEDENPAAGGLTLRRIWTEGGTLYDKTDNDLLSDDARNTLADIVAETIRQRS